MPSVSRPAFSRLAHRGVSAVLAACLLCAAAGSPALAADKKKQAAPANYAIDASTPDGLVKSITADVMNAVKADPSIQKGDTGKISALVDQKILPYTDLQRTTRLAMGRSWVTPTPDQRSQILEQFKMLLGRTYAGALAQVRDQRVDYKPLRAPADATDVVVQSQVVGQGQPAPLDYRVAKGRDGWRVYDINVRGAWLVPTYHQMFTEQINKHGIDGLIQFLRQRNQQLADSK